MAAAAPDLSIVAPVYNEAENFPKFYGRLKESVRTPYQLLVVYDSEDDTTLPCAREFQKSDPSVVLVKNDERGVLGALKTGLRYPKSGALLVTMADGSDDLGQVDAMVELYRQGYSVVAASRYARGGRQLGGPPLKKALSRVAGLSLKLLAGVPTSDPTNNFKLYSKELIDKIEIESQGGFEVALELTVKAYALGLRIAEIPTVWTDRVAGQSNFKLLKWMPHYLRWYRAALAHRAAHWIPG